MTTVSRRHVLTLAASAVALAWTPRIAYAQGMITPGETDVLAVIDVQNCFVPGGTLPVPEGDKIIPIINRLAPAFRHVVITQDWHTKGHVSYAAFLEADRKTKTGLTGYLKERGLTRVFFVGLATDFCVAWSALDARKAGFEALVIEDATRG